MDATPFTMKKGEEPKTKNEQANKIMFEFPTKKQILGFLLTLVVSVLFSVSYLYFASAINWLHLFLKGETRKAISFFIYGYKILLFLFRGDKKGDIGKLLSGPGGELMRNTLYLNLLETAREVHDRLVNIDWLYWTMLFLPFFVVYAIVQETLLKLHQNVRYLRADCSLKSSFIKWQSSMHIAMHQRIAELRVEVKALNSVLEGYRQNAKENEQKNKLLRKNYEEEEETVPSEKDTEPPSEGERTLAKKNKSDSMIEERRDEIDTQIQRKVRPKTEEGRYATVDQYMPKKCITPAWMGAKKRLQERSREILKSRVDSVRRAKEQSTQQCLAIVEGPDDEKKALVSPKALPVKPTLEKRIAIARSKFTDRKASDDNRSLMSREAKTPPKRSSEESKILAHKEVISELKSRQEKQQISVSATDLLQQQETMNRLSTKKRSLSEAGKSATRCDMVSKAMQDHDHLQNVSFENEEDIVANLGLAGIGRVTSYTEIYKKKVLVPKSGKAPEITIEGKRRWCF